MCLMKIDWPNQKLTKNAMFKTVCPTCIDSTLHPASVAGPPSLTSRGVPSLSSSHASLIEHRLLITVDHWPRDIVCLLAQFVVAVCPGGRLPIHDLLGPLSVVDVFDECIIGWWKGAEFNR